MDSELENEKEEFKKPISLCNNKIHIFNPVKSAPAIDILEFSKVFFEAAYVKDLFEKECSYFQPDKLSNQKQRQSSHRPSGNLKKNKILPYVLEKLETKFSEWIQAEYPDSSAIALSDSKRRERSIRFIHRLADILESNVGHLLQKFPSKIKSQTAIEEINAVRETARKKQEKVEIQLGKLKNDVSELLCEEYFTACLTQQDLDKISWLYFELHDVESVINNAKSILPFERNKNTKLAIFRMFMDRLVDLFLSIYNCIDVNALKCLFSLHENSDNLIKIEIDFEKEIQKAKGVDKKRKLKSLSMNKGGLDRISIEEGTHAFDFFQLFGLWIPGRSIASPPPWWGLSNQAE